MLDLSDVTFLGSAGLAVLVAAKDDAELHRHRFRLVPGSRIVTRALEATGLLGLFDIADGVPQALETSGWPGPWRRQGAWWPPRSSTPTWPSISARRVRFPSASATRDRRRHRCRGCRSSIHALPSRVRAADTRTTPYRARPCAAGLRPIRPDQCQGGGMDVRSACGVRVDRDSGIDLTALSAAEIVARVHDGRSSAVDVARAHLARIADADDP